MLPVIIHYKPSLAHQQMINALKPLILKTLKLDKKTKILLNSYTTDIDPDKFYLFIKIGDKFYETEILQNFDELLFQVNVQLVKMYEVICNFQRF